MKKDLTIIIVGTEYKTLSGGIAYALNALVSLLKIHNEKFVFLPSHNSQQRFGKWLPFVGALFRLPFLIFKLKRRKEHVVIYAHAGALTSLVRKSILLSVARCCGVETVIQLHAPEYDTYLASQVKRVLVKVLLTPAQKICVLTPWWKTRFKRSGFSQGLCVVPNAMPLEWEKESGRPVLPCSRTKDVQIFCMARLEPGKGVDVLISALSLLPPSYKLVIAGDGSIANRLHRQVKEVGLISMVRFLGWIDEGQKRLWFKNSDIFCLPSASDSFGMVFIEAMSRGLPVVAYDNGPVADVVPNDFAGFLSKECTSESVAETIKKLDSVELRYTMSQNAKRWVKNNYSQARVYKKIQNALFNI